MVDSTAKYASKLITQGVRKREYFAIAPMVDVSDKFFRYLMRKMSKHAFLYTEMINEHAVLHSKDMVRGRLLDFSPCSHPVVF